MSDPRIRFGIIGAAGRGNSFVRALQANPAAELSALCDVREEQLQANAAELEVQQTFTDAGKMIRSGTVDAVVIGTPMQFHAPQAILALEHDIHVLSEVTAAVSIEESRELVRAARRSGATYMMAENYTYTKSSVLVKELARRGLFGTPYYGEGAYVHELKQHNVRTPWRRRWQTGINACTYPTHSLGPVLQWFNASEARPDRVVAVSAVGTGHHYRDPRGDSYEMEDSVTMMCRLASGGLVQIRVDMLSDRPHHMVHYALQGTDGAYESADSHQAPAKIWLRERHATPTWEPMADLEQEFLPEYWKNPPVEAQQAGHGGGDYWEVQDFIRAILQEREVPIGIDAAMDMTLPGLVSEQSLAQGSSWVAVPDPRSWT
jgi:predicted dehydrogenase